MPQGVRKNFYGDLKFRCTVTPQINIMESAEGKTIVGWSGGVFWKKLPANPVNDPRVANAVTLKSTFRPP